MAAYKKKKIRQKEIPPIKHVGQIENPESYYDNHPAWNFNTCDKENWTFSKDAMGDFFWDSVLPRLKDFETETWRQILVVAKKNNHSIDCRCLNPIAQKRLADLYIEQESIISLRIDGTHRVYGYVSDSVFNIIWYDPFHGDNDYCVCRSYKKNT